MNVLSALLSISCDDRQVIRYYRFVLACQATNVSDGYSEHHHICPKSLFPQFASLRDNPWNKAKLTARQHYIAHWMLWKAYGKKMAYAFKMMNSVRNKHQLERGFRIRPKTLDLLKRDMSPSQETRRKLSEKLRGRKNPRNAGTLNERFGEDRADQIKAKMKRRVVSPEIRRRTSDRVSNSVWLHNQVSEVLVQMANAPEYERQGYVRGRRPGVVDLSKRRDMTGMNNALYGKSRDDLAARNRLPKAWITDEVTDKQILREDVEIWLDKGWRRGRTGGKPHSTTTPLGQTTNGRMR